MLRLRKVALFASLVGLTSSACSSSGGGGGGSGGGQAGGGGTQAGGSAGGGIGGTAGAGGTTQQQDAGPVDAAAAGAGGTKPPLWSASVCPAGSAATVQIPSNAQATLVKDGFVGTEGPVWLNGVLYFSDINRNASGNPSKIQKLTPPSTVEVWLDPSGTNGLGLTIDHKIIAAAFATQSLTVFDPATKMAEILVDKESGVGFNAPNDLTSRSDGHIYFTDPQYQVPGAPPRAKTAVFHVAPDKSVSIVDDSLPNPNGIALSLDETTLYVGSLSAFGDYGTGNARIWRYTLAADGSATKQGLFLDQTKVMGANPDGMVIDCAGDLYVSSSLGVEVFSPSGTPLGVIKTAQSDGATNMAFGGADGKTLYITSDTYLSSIVLNTPGFPF